MKQTRRAAALPVAFFRRPTEVVAAELIGKVVVSTVGGLLTAGRIVETEAYLGYDDPASHGYRHRRNARNAALFGPPGIWYVYLSYGMHWCANLVCQRAGLASAVLLRALEPLEGLDVMRRAQGRVAGQTAMLRARAPVSGVGHQSGSRRIGDGGRSCGGPAGRSCHCRCDLGHSSHRHHQGGGLATAFSSGRLALDIPQRKERRILRIPRPLSNRSLVL